MLKEEQFRRNLAEVLGKMERLCDEFNRSPDELTLLPVTKKWPSEAVRFCQRAEIMRVGENRVQDALVKQRLEAVRRLRGNDDYVMAEMELSRLHQDFPENPTILYEITKLWNQGNKHRLTIEALGSIASIDKMPAMLLFNLASARHALGQKEAAIILYERVLLLEPANESAMCNLANCFHENGDLNRAFKMISRAIEINSVDPRSYYNLAQICIDQKDLNSAVKALEEALKLNPNHKKSRHSLALVFLLQGRAMSALEEVNAVLRDDPEYSYALITKALALFELGRRSESFSVFDHLWNTGIQSLPVLNNLAIHYVLENRLDDAKNLHYIYFLYLICLYL